MARRGEFDYVIVNEPGRLEATVDHLLEVLDVERLKPRHGDRRGWRATS